MVKRLDEAVRNGYLASYTISPPFVDDIATNDKANRLLPDIPFEGVLAGAIHTIKINGSALHTEPRAAASGQSLSAFLW